VQHIALRRGLAPHDRSRVVNASRTEVVAGRLRNLASREDDLAGAPVLAQGVPEVACGQKLVDVVDFAVREGSALERGVAYYADFEAHKVGGTIGDWIGGWSS
jgi:hypothetical protein